MQKQSLFALALTALVLGVLVFVAVRGYDNVSTLLHVDVPFGEEHNVPHGVVLYTDAAYDGMLYYQITRDIPALFSGGTTSLDSPYRFQRILLPLFVYVLTFGNEAYYPWAILLINIAAALGTLALFLAITKRVTVHALAVVFNPAMLVGILYALTEPLSIFFIMLFLWDFQRRHYRMTVVCIAALFLSLLARETTVFLMFPLLLWFLWKREWKNVIFLAVPVVLFVGWQYFLILQLGSLPFRSTTTHILTFPFVGPVTMIWWSIIHTGVQQMSHLGSLTLFIFLSGVCALLARRWYRERFSIDLYAFLLSGLCATMLCMDSHMWGAITSIGRVVTPIYAIYALYAWKHDSRATRATSAALIALSLVTALGIAVIRHPFIIS